MQQASQRPRYEDQSNNYVEFDDFKVTYTPGNVVQGNENDAFGMPGRMWLISNKLMI